MDHKKTAIECFNLCWDFMDKQDRTKEDDLKMIALAHRSLHHWKLVGTPLNEARGEWQVSRVYSILGIGEAALYHGLKSLTICQQNNIGDFDLAFGYEAVARAYSVMNDDQVNEYLEKGFLACDDIVDEGNKA